MSDDLDARQDLRNSVIRVLNAKGEVVGSGFVVAARLPAGPQDCVAATCAHVIEQARKGAVDANWFTVNFYDGSGAAPSHAHTCAA